MAAAGSARNGPNPARSDANAILAQPCVDALVVGVTVAVLFSALLLLLAMQGGVHWLPWPPHSLRLRCLSVAVIGATVGYAELVSRYRDEPFKVTRCMAAALFIGLNAFAATVALLMLEHFTPSYTPADGVARVLLAGTGAMLVLRSKLLTLRQSDGTDVAVGPAYVIDVLLSAVNRDVDRVRANTRHEIVMAMAKTLSVHDFRHAVPYLNVSMAAFQAIDKEDRTRIKEQLDRYLSSEYDKMSAEMKFAGAGFDILTLFGDRTYRTVFGALGEYLATIKVPDPNAPPAPPSP